MTENQLVQSSFFQTDLFANISYHTETVQMPAPSEAPQMTQAAVQPVAATDIQAAVPAETLHRAAAEAPLTDSKMKAPAKSLDLEAGACRATEFSSGQLSDGERQTSFEFVLEEVDAEALIVKNQSADKKLEISTLQDIPEEALVASDDKSSFKLETQEAQETSEMLESVSPSEILATPLIERKPVFIQEISLPAALCDEALILEINSIPNKMGFKIGEVAEMLGIKQYVLRYWESEFDVLKPKKAANNQRYFTKKDVENAYLIRKLLHRDRFSIEGAKSAMKELKSFVKTEVKKERVISNMSQTLQSVDEMAIELLSNIRRVKNLFKTI